MTDVFEVPETLAENCCVALSFSTVDGGVIVTEMVLE
jgi:hypothetical protein